MMMKLVEKLNIPGEHAFLEAGKAGRIEGVLTVPSASKTDFVALLGHPHSLQGGTMNNKVVTTMARVFKELAIPSIRFNFRGVGQSEGVYDEGVGESEDLLMLAEQWQSALPNARFLFAGFSFGSYVAYRAAAHCKPALLITIAPPVHHYDYKEFSKETFPWIIVQGDEDEVVPAERVFNFAEEACPPLPVLRFSETGHFFHGKLIELKSRLLKEIRTRVPLL